MATLERKGVRVHVRWMIRRDMPGVMAVERATGGTWSQDDFLTRLRRHTCIGMVAEDAKTDVILGFVIYELRKDYIEVERLATVARVGIDAALLDRVRQKVAAPFMPRKFMTLPGGGGESWAVQARPEWVTSDVRFLCGGDEMPALWALADALQEAGCDDERLLTLFRTGGPVAGVIYTALRPGFCGEDGYGPKGEW